MKIRIAFTLSVVTVAAVLSSCTVTSGYRVRSTVTLQDGDRTLSQSLYSTCTRIGRAGGRAGQMVTVGWRPWFARPDGSILILGDQLPCRQGQAPAYGTPIFSSAPWNSPSTTWLFDSTTKPTRADLFDTSRLGDGARFRLLNVQTAPALHLPSKGLDTAFPWLASVSARVPAARLQTAGPPAGVFTRGVWPGNMIGWVAQAYVVEGASKCTGQSAPLVSLEDDSACKDLRPCGGGEAVACLRKLGNLRMTPTTGFQQLELDSATPEPAYIATMYTTIGRRELQALFDKDASAICFHGACAAIAPRPGLQQDVYLPQNSELVRVSETFDLVGLTQFRNSSLADNGT